MMASNEIGVILVCQKREAGSHPNKGETISKIKEHA
jgi:hypothetical protein